jgi:hypothetical protein
MAAKMTSNAAPAVDRIAPDFINSVRFTEIDR